MKKVLLILLISNTLCVWGQKEGNIWYFGNNAGITFNTNPPTALTNGKLIQREGCSTVCDANGSLLFYTDGQKVYDKTHNVMPNGSGLLGNNSSCQSGVIVPWPDSIYKYYIFTADAIENGAVNGLRYSIIDMRLNNGKGDIISNQKNMILLKTHCEKVTAVLHCNKRDFWLISNKEYTDSILAFQITPSGINKKSINSNTGLLISGNNLDNNLGYLNPNHDGTKIASCHYLLDKVLLMDFDNQTGKFSNVITLNKKSPYGCEFSPNNKLLYVSGLRSPTSIDQFDISSNNQTSIQQSKLPIFDYQSGEMGTLKLAPNGCIYATSETSGFNFYLGCIQNPDSIGAYFNPKKIYLAGKTARLGLPNIFYSKYKPSSNKLFIQDSCFNNITKFKITNTGINKSISWDFGDISSGANNTATGNNVTHIFSKSGKFKIKTIIQNDCKNDTIINYLNILSNIKPYLGKDTNLCDLTNFQLKSNIIANKYEWNNSVVDSFSIYNPKRFGLHYLKISNACGIYRDTIKIDSLTQNQPFNLGNDTTYCSNTNFKLFAPKIFNRFLWNNGDTTNSIVIDKTGTYWLKGSNKCGESSDTINIIKVEPINFNLGNDTFICFNTSFKLTGPPNMKKYNWNNLYYTQVIFPNKEGFYKLKITDNNNCESVDSIEIKDKKIKNPLKLGEDTTFCNDFIYKLKINSNYSQIKWNIGDTSSIISINSAGEYIVEAFNGCETVSDTIKIIKVIPQKLNIGKDTNICFLRAYKLFSNYGFKQFTWSNGSTDNNIEIKAPGIYWCKAIDNNNCQSIDSINIKRSENDKELFLPNAFSPNFDEINDYFPFDKNIQFNTITIFNRWGEKIYQNFSGIPWNGNYDGKECEQDVYLFFIEYKNCNGVKITKSGTFTLLK